MTHAFAGFACFAAITGRLIALSILTRIAGDFVGTNSRTTEELMPIFMVSARLNRLTPTERMRFDHRKRPHDRDVRINERTWRRRASGESRLGAEAHSCVRASPSYWLRPAIEPA